MNHTEDIFIHLIQFLWIQQKTYGLCFSGFPTSKNELNLKAPRHYLKTASLANFNTQTHISALFASQKSSSQKKGGNRNAYQQK